LLLVNKKHIADDHTGQFRVKNGVLQTVQRGDGVALGCSEAFWMMVRGAGKPVSSSCWMCCTPFTPCNDQRQAGAVAVAARARQSVPEISRFGWPDEDHTGCSCG
jgi:hypothetical protein